MTILNLPGHAGTETNGRKQVAGKASIATQIKRAETDERNQTLRGFTYAIPGSVIGAIDTVGQSLGVFDETTIQDNLDAVQRTIGTGGLAQAYKENSFGYRLIGDVATTVAGYGAVTKLLKGPAMLRNSASVIGLNAKRGSMLDRLVFTDHDRTAKLLDIYTKRAAAFGKTTKSSNLNDVAEFRRLRGQARISQLTNDVKEGIATEAFVFGVQNESELYFPDGIGTGDLVLAGTVGLGVPTIIGQVAMNPAFRRAAGEAGKAAAKENRVYTGSPGFDLVTGIYEREDILLRQREGELADVLRTSPDAGDQIAGVQATADKRINSSIETLRTNQPLPGLSAPAKHDPGVRNVVEQFARTNPRATTALQSIEAAGVADDFAAYTAQRNIGTPVEIAKLQTKMKTVATGSSEWLRYRDEARRLEDELNDLNNNTWVTRINRLGISSGNLGAKTVFDDPSGVSRVHVTSKDIRRQDVVSVTNGSDDRRFGLSPSGAVYKVSKDTGKGNRSYHLVQKTDALSLYDRSKVLQSIPGALRELADAIEKLGAGKALSAQIKTFKASKGNTSVEQLEYLYSAVKQHGFDNQQLRKLIDLSDYANEGELKLDMLNAKYKRYLALTKDAKKLSVKNIELDTDFGMELVVPGATDYDRYSLAVDWFDSLRAAGRQTVADGFDEAEADFMIHSSLGLTPKTIENLAASTNELFDNAFFLDVGAKLGGPNTQRTPVTLVGRRVNGSGTDNWHINWDDHQTVARIEAEERKTTLMRDIENNPYASHLGRLTRRMDEFQDLAQQVRNAIPTISAAQGRTPFLPRAGEIIPTTLDFDQRFVPGSSAASLLNDVVIREAEAISREAIEQNAKAMRDLFLDSNDGSWLRYADYHSSMQRGWQIQVDALAAPEGPRKLIKLDPDSEINKEIAKQAGLDDVPEYLPSSLDTSGNTPVMLDDLSHAALLEANRFSDVGFFSDSALMRANGKGGMTYREGHTIIPSRYGQEMVFLQDQQGKVIDFELGTSVEAASRKLSSRAAQRPDSGMTRIVSKENVEDWHLANNQAWNDSLLDVSDAWRRTAGRAQEGGRTGVILSKDFLRSQIEAVHDMYRNQARRYLATEFRPQLEQLDAMSQAARIDQRGLITRGDTGKAEQAFSNVYQKFRQQLLGDGGIAKGSFTGMAGTAIENGFNAILNKATNVLFDAGIGAGSSRRQLSRANSFEAGFKQLSDDYGFNPVKASLDAVQREFGGDKPIMAQDLAQKAARATTFLALRLFEPAHGALTIASIATTTPHTAAFYRRGVKETVDAYRQRVGATADLLGDGAHALPNPTKLMASTMQRFWRGDYSAVLKEAEKRGYLTAHIAEFMNEMTGPVAKNRTQAMVNKTLEYVTMPTQWSEDFARKFSFLMGYEMFSKVGNKGMSVSLAAANDFANKAIADYRPHQRGQLFRGATGIPLGLFQTFSINYLQRLGVAIENKQARATFTQLGTQAFVFGAGSLPGWSALNEKVLSTWDHTARPEDNFAKMEAEGVADTFLYGTVSNLPRILGLDPIALHTRGEIQTPRTFSIANWKDTPAVSMASRFFTAINEGVKANLKYGELADQKFLESVSLAMPNRPLRGMFDLAVVGYSANKYGDVVSGPDEEFYSTIGIASRVMGLKPMREVKRADAMWRDTQTKIARRNKMEVLRESLTSKIRADGSINAEQLNIVLEDYIAFGGNPKYIRSWMKRVAMKAEFSRYDRELMTKLKSTDRGRDLVNFVTSVDGVNEAAMYGLMDEAGEANAERVELREDLAKARQTILSQQLDSQ